jgi:glycosyltransferase involved in cell wall biosynthesis
MRILIYNWRDLSHPQAGGAEVYTDHVAREWTAQGHDVTLFCSAVEGRPERETTASGYQVIRRGGKHGVYRAARRFWEKEGQEKFDLVVDEVNTRPFGCPRWVTGTPVVAIIHQVAREVWFHETPLPVALVGRFWLEKHWLAPYRDVPTVTLSESSRQSLEHYGLRNLTVVAPGFRPRVGVVRLPEKEGTPTFIFVGRLSWNKRPHDVLRAFALARKQLPEARLWMLGTGPMEKRLRRRPGRNVEFFGRTSEAEKLERMARAHALLVTSVREGWGLVVTEAASVGTPSIGYDVAGLRDSIAASGGLLVGPRPNDLASTLIAQLQALLDGAHHPVPEGVISWDSVADGILRSASQSAASEERIQSAIQPTTNRSTKTATS